MTKMEENILINKKERFLLPKDVLFLCFSHKWEGGHMPPSLATPVIHVTITIHVIITIKYSFLRKMVSSSLSY